MDIGLTDDEALVLFDFLARFQEANQLEFEHVAEFIVLSKVRGALEETLVEPFDSQFQTLLRAARKRLSAGWEPLDDYPGPKVARDA
ncbi:MAG: hypothetical protein FJY56_06325 [Betaproteobacteria bacterium]|nr:hypothetical protein [Betaproteobacteria bacterium]